MERVLNNTNYRYFMTLVLCSGRIIPKNPLDADVTSLLSPQPASEPARSHHCTGHCWKMPIRASFQLRGPEEACEAAPEAHFKSFLLMYLLERLELREA